MRFRFSLILIFSIALLLSAKPLAFGQKESKVQQTVFHSWDGYMFPTKGTFRALVIYVNIIYNDTVPDPVPGNDIWPQSVTEGLNVDTTSWPRYIHNFIDTQYPSDSAMKTFTRIYAESSFHELILLGDYMVVNISHTTIGDGGKFTSAQLLDSVMQMINTTGGISTVHGHNSIGDYATIKDSTFDYVKFILRNSKTDYGDFGVGNGSGGSGDWVKLRTSEGIICKAHMATVQCVGNMDLATNPTSIVIHEFSHLLFGGNTFHTSGGHSWGGKMCFPSIQYGYGLMGGASSGLVSCNGFDRFRAGWMGPDNNTGWPIAASGVISDVSRADGNQVFMLRDFVTTGDVIRIKLPHLQAQASNQYIWLENHKTLETNLDFLQYENTHTCRPKAQKGIYAYYQVGKDTLVGARGSVYTSHDADNLRMICANGNYDQQYAGTVQGNCIGSGQFSHFIDTLPNPLSGNSDLSAYFLDIPGDDTLKPGIHARNAMAKTYFGNPNDTVRHLPYLMSDINAFTGYREMSLNTNPAPFNVRTYYHSPKLVNKIWVTEPVDVFRNQDAVELSGLKIIMTPAGNDDYQVEISWNNYELETNARWTGHVNLAEELYINPGATLLLDQNLTPNSIYRNPVTGKFCEPTLMRCSAGSIMMQRQGSALILENQSTLKLDSGSLFVADGGVMQIKNGSTFLLGDGSVFRQESGAIAEVENNGSIFIGQGSHYIIDGGLTSIKPGGRMEIESCATLEILNGGLLEIQSFAEICIHPGAFIVFDSLQNLSFGFGFSTGNCLWFTPATFLEKVIATPPTYHVNDNVQWNNATYNFSEDLRIDSAAVLTLSGGSELRFAPGKRIIVERGAQLIVNDSKLTNLCENQSWAGIEVWGNLDKSQHEFGEQALVQINDRSMVGNAEIGILSGRRLTASGIEVPEEFDPAYGGGIIRANQAYFRNNRVGIYFTPYENRNAVSGHVKNNLSRIENCDFLNTGQVFTKQTFVMLNNVRGVDLRGNQFTGPPVAGANTTGILSLNSSFSLKPSHSTNNPVGEEHTPSRFSNLNFGIMALGTGSEKTFTTDSTVFYNNNNGIYTRAVNNFRVVNSIFRIPSVSSSARRGGLYVDGNVLGFQVEGNSFTGTYTGVEVSTGITFGASFNSLGQAANTVDGNIFDSLHVGILAMNQNRHISGPGGLTLKCNNFLVNRHAIMVLYDKNIYNWGGIALYQGSNALPAGNSFTSSQNWEADIYNHARPVLYFHSDPSNTPFQAVPQQFTTDSVFIFNTHTVFDPWLDCPVTPVITEQSDCEVMCQEFSNKLAVLQNDELWYREKVDGGNATQLLQWIHRAHEAEAPDIIRYLKNISPWLSDSVLIAAINAKSLFPDVMIHGLLSTNSQALRSPRVLNALSGRLGKMPAYMKESILEGKSILSEKEAFEAMLLQQKASLMQLVRNITHCLLNDTLNTLAHSQLLHFYLSNPDPDYHRVAAMMLMEQGDIFGAGMIINAMQHTTGSESDLAATQGNLKTMIEKMYLLSMQGKSIYIPDSATVQWLQWLAGSGSDQASVYAENILAANGMFLIAPVYMFPALVDAPPIKPPTDGEEPQVVKVMNLFPNPAGTYIIADIDLSRIAGFVTEQPVIRIAGIDGRHVASIAVQRLMGQTLINLEKVPAGMYILSLYLADKHLQSEKLVVVKR